MVASFSLAFWSRARYPFGFEAGAVVVGVEAAGAGFGADFATGGVDFRGATAVLAEAVGFFATAFAGFVEEGAAVPRYGTVVVED